MTTENTTTQSNTPTDHTVNQTIPVRSANHYLLLFAMLLPFAISGLFGLFNASQESVTAVFQTKVLSFGIILICLLPFSSVLWKNPRFRNRPHLPTVGWGFLYNLFAVGGTSLFITAFFPQWLGSIPSFEAASSFEYWLLPITLAVIVPLEEELVFRGVLLNSYERILSPRTAFIAVSLIFALIHAIPAQVLTILPVCFILTRITQVSNSIWTAVILHMLVNGLASLANMISTSEMASDAAASINQDNYVSPTVGLLGLSLTFTMLWIAYRKWGLPSNTKPNIQPENIQAENAQDTKLITQSQERLWTMSLILVIIFSAITLFLLMANPEMLSY